MLVIGYREGLASPRPYETILASTSADNETLVAAVVDLALTLTAHEDT
jgi:hypothetical protein